MVAIKLDNLDRILNLEELAKEYTPEEIVHLQGLMKHAKEKQGDVIRVPLYRDVP